MASIPVLRKKRGRPATGVDPLLNFRADEALREAINRAMTEAGQGSRSEYIRLVLTDHLRAKGYLPATSESSS